MTKIKRISKKNKKKTNDPMIYIYYGGEIRIWIPTFPKSLAFPMGQKRDLGQEAKAKAFKQYWLSQFWFNILQDNKIYFVYCYPSRILAPSLRAKRLICQHHFLFNKIFIPTFHLYFSSLSLAIIIGFLEVAIFLGITALGILSVVFFLW